LEPTNTRPPAIAGDESTRARVVIVQTGFSACSIRVSTSLFERL